MFYSFASKPPNRNDQSSKAQTILGTSEPDQQQALLETATAEQVHCLYEKKIFNAEVCNDETPTLQT